MGNLTFEQIFRYALPGGITLLVLFGCYTPDSQWKPSLAIGEAAVLTGIALIAGGLIYTVHRASLFPFINWLLLWRQTTQSPDRDMKRWEARAFAECKTDSEETKWGKQMSQLSEWGTQIHYLYCSVWAIVLGHALACLLRWDVAHPRISCASVVFAFILLVMAIVHQVRYLRYENELLGKQPPPKKPC